VRIDVIGGGLTAGKTTIDEGEGTFSEVKDISEIFGSYAQAEASAGAGESVSAQAMTKGEVSLAITTEGRGWKPRRLGRQVHDRESRGTCVGLRLRAEDAP